MPDRRRIFRPHTLMGKVITNKASGSGMGSVLLDKGGAGSGSSYYSMEDYLATTGKGLSAPPIGKGGRKTMGLGLGGAIEDKLSKLMVKPEIKTRKPKNIQFEM